MGSRIDRRLIFLDIDGTLAMLGSAPGTATVEAVRTARKNGHMVFLSTGRARYGVPSTIEAIGFDGGIYFAGGYAEADCETILDQPMNASLAKQVIDILQGANLIISLECGKCAYQSPKIAELWKVIGDSSASTELRRALADMNGKSLANYGGEDIYKIGFIASRREDIAAVERRLGDAAKLVRFDNMMPAFPLIFSEISSWEINKGNALKRICDHLGAAQEQCVAFGDSMNDSEILQAAGIGVAMGNAEDGLKALADRVCEPCAEDGIAKELQRIGLV